MEWLFWLVIIIIILRFTTYLFKDSHNTETNTDCLEQQITSDKAYLKKVYKEIYESDLYGESLFTDRKLVLEQLVEREKDIRMLDKWSSEVTTILASDAFSTESKNKLLNSWYEKLHAERHARETSPYIFDNEEFDSLLDNSREAYSKFVATLKAFDIDSEKDEKDIEKEVKNYIKALYANTKIPLKRPKGYVKKDDETEDNEG